MNTSLYHVV